MMRFGLVCALFLSGCGDPGSTSDGAAACTPASCDDGVFCNGAEVCTEGSCVAATSPCGADACDEATDRCTCTSTDTDGDSHLSMACGGDDCDDEDVNRYPGNPEVCDVMNRDEDCDPSTFGVRDADGDDAPDAACCNEEGGTMNCGDDCDDTRAGVGPSASEVCNERDDDCDTNIDEGGFVRCFADADGDSYAEAAAEVSMDCTCPPDTTLREPVAGAIDCGEGDPDTHPGATERCDRVDNDCSSGGGVEEAEDADVDGHAPEDAACTGGAMVRDDCHDGERDVHGGQTDFFVSPYCDDPTTEPCPDCGGRCLPPGSCGSLPCSLAIGNWDYNCDAVEQRQAPGSSCAENGTICQFDSECGMDGVNYTGTPSCGSLVDSVRCGRCERFSCGNTVATSMVPLPCR